nr:chitinase 3 [Diaphanosoma celebensis]
MTTIIRIIVTSFLFCGLFASLVFFSKLSSAILGFYSHSVASIGATSPWNLENYSNFTPGLGNRFYRQEVYSKAAHHHNKHLHQVRKFRITKTKHSENIPLKVVCYVTLPSDGWPTLTSENINGTLCTHIIIGFAHIWNNSLCPFKPNDEFYFKEVVSMKQFYPHLKILLSVGGGTKDAGFTETISSNSKREEFAIRSAKYLKSIGIDGIDIDWEFPAWYTPFEERFLFIKFVQELHMVYKNPINKLLISVAVAASKSIIDRSYRVAELANYVDFVNMMGYDLHSFKWYLPLTGHNSPLYARSDDWNMFGTVNLNWTAYYWVQLGMPKEKIIIGLPTYGQSYILYNPTFHGVYAPAVGAGFGGGQIAYTAVCEFLANGAIREYDYESRVPYAYQKRNWISYDDEQSLEEKAQWIQRNHFGGVMVFDLNCDDFSNVCGNITFPLLKSILRGLKT